MNLSKTLLERKQLVFIFTGLILILIISCLVVNFKFGSSLVNEQTKNDSSLSTRIKIPSLNIDAEVENVGITQTGAMDVPRAADHTGWYDLGTSPGFEGSAVIDGHSGWKDNKPAVFDNLYRLKTGDKIYVVNKKGTVLTFVVNRLVSYGKDEDAYNVFNSKDGKSHLNLITCAGDWNEILKTHSSRIVVFADLDTFK